MHIAGSLRTACIYLKGLMGRFGRSNGGLVAAAVSFYIFLSLVPLVLLAVATFGVILRSEEHAHRTVLDFLRTYSPALAADSDLGVRPLLEEIVRGSHTATGIGIAALLWAGSQAFVTLEKAVNTAWGCRDRGFIAGRLMAIGLLFAVGVLLLISFGITTAANAVQTYRITFLGRSLTDAFGSAWQVLALALPLAVSIATFTLIYKVLPNTRIPFRSAFTGGAVAGILWEIAKHAFSWYVTRFTHYNATYGSLAGVILLLVWINYSSVVAILGAHVSAMRET